MKTGFVLGLQLNRNAASLHCGGITNNKMMLTRLEKKPSRWTDFKSWKKQHVWSGNCNSNLFGPCLVTKETQTHYVLKQWSAIPHPFCCTQCHKRGEVWSWGDRQRYVLALQFQCLGEQTALIFLRSIHNQDRLKTVVWVEERARNRLNRLKAGSHNVVYLVARNFWFFQGLWIYPLQWDKTGHFGVLDEKFLLLSWQKARKRPACSFWSNKEVRI